MQSLLFIICFLMKSSCLDLYLPLNENESEIFHIDKQVEFTTSIFSPPTFIHTTVTYESKTEELISRVFYQNIEIFHDTHEHGSPERRIVTFTVLPTTIIISVHTTDIDKKRTDNEFEAQFFIDHDNMYDLAHNIPTKIHIVNNHQRAVKEKEIMTLLSRKEMEAELYPSFLFFPTEYMTKWIKSLIPKAFKKRDETSEQIQQESTENNTDSLENVDFYEDEYQLRGTLEGTEYPKSDESQGDTDQTQTKINYKDQHPFKTYIPKKTMVY